MKTGGWQDRFFAYIEESRTRPFEWAVFDCCLFAADVVDVVTGSTYRAQLADKYSDETTALAYIDSFGTLEIAISSWLGDSQAPNFAGPGDIVIGDLEGRLIAGVCLGTRCAFASTNGPRYTDRSVISACWVV